MYRGRTRHRTGLIILGLLGSAPVAALGVEQGAEQAFALVVAHNGSLDPTVRPLRYADDDGGRFFEWALAFAEHAVLLSVFDGETQSRFPGLAELSRAPTRAEITGAMTDLRERMLRAKRNGARTVFYFYFAGHGDIGADREGYLNLLDGRFRRSDLYREVIARSPADTNHVIVDACNAYFMVHRRGALQRGTEQAVRSFLQQESLERYPHTGVVLSTASAAETHEWSRYGSGIFSHELLSGLLGAADVNGDAKVSYSEIAAFISAANLSVRDARARLQVYAQPPRRDARTPLSNIASLRHVAMDEHRPASGRIGAFLRLPQSATGHYYLEDDRGLRYLDLNKSGEQPIRLALLDRPYYYLRTAEREAVVRLDRGRDIGAGSLDFGPLSSQARGSVEESFRRDLFRVPFGLGFAAGYGAALERQSDHAGIALNASAPDERWYARAALWKWTLAGLAAGAAGLGLGMQLWSNEAGNSLESGAGEISMSRAIELQEEAHGRQAVAAASFGVAGVAALASLVLFVVDAAR